MWRKASWKRGTEPESKEREPWWFAPREWRKQRGSRWQVADAWVTGLSAQGCEWCRQRLDPQSVAVSIHCSLCDTLACSGAHSSQIPHWRSIDQQIWWATAVSSLWISRQLWFELSYHLSLLPRPPFSHPQLWPCFLTLACELWESGHHSASQSRWCSLLKEGIIQ